MLNQKNPSAQWSAEQANAWYADLPWQRGANFAPANAINQLEMWQAETFDPERIDLELSWAAGLGMNIMRVFLHDLCWEQDREGFLARIETFLSLCEKHKIRVMMVLFDSVWHPFPKTGRQPEPTPGVHNSGWVQSPGAEALTDPAHYDRLRDYVVGVVTAFADDDRILVWDVWNEPDNTNDASYGPGNLKLEPEDKHKYVLDLLPKVFEWVRAAGPSQPLTSGVWRGDWSSHEMLLPIYKVQIELSDVLSFHNYDPAEVFERRIHELSRYNRPIFCTEYMARGMGNTFEAILPLMKKYKIGAINWGFVAGKTQTNLPWDSWQKPYVDREPDIWFHDIFHEDGRAYSAQEIVILKDEA
ncbi:MAG: hypothetical protein JWO78_383 [Micavibrio sp.]|nr:hypothetical protein [Micavibrio sp.]